MSLKSLRPTFVFAQWWAFEAASCPRNHTLNEDNTLNLHFTPPLRKHFVGNRWAPSVNLTQFLNFLRWCFGSGHLVTVNEVDVVFGFESTVIVGGSENSSRVANCPGTAICSSLSAKISCHQVAVESCRE